MLLNSFLICLKINTTINFHFIQKIFHLNDNIRNEPNKPENNFINKKTKRDIKENKINENIKEIKKNKVFCIKKVKDKSKEIEENKKIIKKNIKRRSKFRGVTRKGNEWQALIMINRSKNYIGKFKSEEEAAKVYDEYAMKFHKNKARLNFPHQGFLSI